MSEISRDVIFSEKKAPAGMPTHRTGFGVAFIRGHIDLDTQGGIYIYIHIYIYIYILFPPLYPPTPTPVRCVGIPAGAFFSEKMTSLEISDMYFVNFDVFGQYLNNVWSMLVQQLSAQVYMSPILRGGGGYR